MSPPRSTSKQKPEPRASRPYMPEYGILPPTEGQGLLPWTWAVERLVRAHNYWFATTRPDRTPHAVAVFEKEDAFCGSATRWQFSPARMSSPGRRRTRARRQRSR